MQIPLLRQSPCELQLWLHVAARSWEPPPSGRACAQRASKQKAVAAQCDIIQKNSRSALLHTSSSAPASSFDPDSGRPARSVLPLRRAGGNSRALSRSYANGEQPSG